MSVVHTSALFTAGFHAQDESNQTIYKLQIVQPAGKGRNRLVKANALFLTRLHTGHLYDIHISALEGQAVAQLQQPGMPV